MDPSRLMFCVPTKRRSAAPLVPRSPRRARVRPPESSLVDTLRLAARDGTEPRLLVEPGPCADLRAASVVALGDQKSMPPMPPVGSPPMGAAYSGSSGTTASVVRDRAAGGAAP